MDTVLTRLKLPLFVLIFNFLLFFLVGGGVLKVYSETTLISERLDMNNFVGESLLKSVKYTLNCNKKYTQ